MDKEMYTAKEVAGILRKHVKTIRRMLWHGDIRGVQTGKGGHWRIPASEVKRLKGEGDE